MIAEPWDASKPNQFELDYPSSPPPWENPLLLLVVFLLVFYAISH